MTQNKCQKKEMKENAFTIFFMNIKITVIT